MTHSTIGGPPIPHRPSRNPPRLNASHSQAGCSRGCGCTRSDHCTSDDRQDDHADELAGQRPCSPLPMPPQGQRPQRQRGKADQHRPQGRPIVDLAPQLPGGDTILHGRRDKADRHRIGQRNARQHQERNAEQPRRETHRPLHDAAGQQDQADQQVVR